MEIVMSEDILQKIYCVLDIQGYSLSGEFFPRELSIVNDDLNIVWNIDPELEMNNKNRSEIGFHIRELHGLIPKPDYGDIWITRSSLPTMLKILFSVLVTEDKPYVAVKNCQVASILKKLGLTFVNMEKGENTPPSIKKLDKDRCRWMCLLHSNPYPTQRKCALRKSCLIWEWINNEINDY